LAEDLGREEVFWCPACPRAWPSNRQRQETKRKKKKKKKKRKKKRSPRGKRSRKGRERTAKRGSIRFASGLSLS
jgi:hypothetical protein